MAIIRLNWIYYTNLTNLFSLLYLSFYWHILDIFSLSLWLICFLSLFSPTRLLFLLLFVFVLYVPCLSFCLFWYDNSLYLLIYVQQLLMIKATLLPGIYTACVLRKTMRFDALCTNDTSRTSQDTNFEPFGTGLLLVQKSIWSKSAKRS
jgi:hypothetical protein